MITIIPGQLKSSHRLLVSQMHRQRKKVFADQLKWNVSVIGDLEIDGYDALDPVYVICHDKNYTVSGSVRLLPTTGFNMLNDTFSALLPGGEKIASPLIWEMSRFTVQADGARRNDLLRVAQTTGELILAVNNLGVAIGLTHFVTVYAAAMHRMFALSGLSGEPIGPPTHFGDVQTYAVTYELGDDLTSRLRRLAGDAEVVLDTALVRSLAIAA
jgi:acyl homoserine lactone synthase